jgi:hypothetical protein
MVLSTSSGILLFVLNSQWRLIVTGMRSRSETDPLRSYDAQEGACTVAYGFFRCDIGMVVKHMETKYSIKNPP